MRIDLKVASDKMQYSLGVSHPMAVDVGMDVGITKITGEHYTGVTHVTPSDQVQTLSTTALVVDEDIVIDPIPNNYGLITWDGSTLMVS